MRIIIISLILNIFSFSCSNIFAQNIKISNLKSAINIQLPEGRAGGIPHFSHDKKLVALNFVKDRNKDGKIYMPEDGNKILIFNFEKKKIISIIGKEKKGDFFYGYSIREWSPDDKYLLAIEGLCAPFAPSCYVKINIKTGYIKQISEESQDDDFWPVFTKDGGLIFKPFKEVRKIINNRKFLKLNQPQHFVNNFAISKRKFIKNNIEYSIRALKNKKGKILISNLSGEMYFNPSQTKIVWVQKGEKYKEETVWVGKPDFSKKKRIDSFAPGLYEIHEWIDNNRFIISGNNKNKRKSQIWVVTVEDF